MSKQESSRYADLARQLRESLIEQETAFRDTLILNPIENVPKHEILEPAASFLHGLYNTDTVRTMEQKAASKIQFSGRDRITDDISHIYECWSELLHAEKISMRLLSGLHAHIVIMMAATNIGDKVLYLPERAGGHTSGKAILERLGLSIIELPIDEPNTRVDAEAALSLAKSAHPDVLFVDRSEGLIYEDFSWVRELPDSCYKIFDASQYLTNVLAGDYMNPFDMGFDLFLSTMHKNLPGPQRAFVCTKKDDERWRDMRSLISKYVSNMHVFSIYSTGLMLDDLDHLRALSKNMLVNAVKLEECLSEHDVPVVSRVPSVKEPPTHHCWILPPTKEKAFDYSVTLERIGLLANYRLLPYGLGYGLRLGLSGATQSGLREADIEELADIMAKAYQEGYSDALRDDARHFIHRVKGIE